MWAPLIENRVSDSPSADWRRELRDALRTAEDLVQEGLIAPSEAEGLKPVLEKYRFLLPRYYARLIDRANPLCPIRLQCMPQRSETLQVPGFRPDPLNDAEHRPTPRITHRYQGRLLLHLTANCSMYCRFCFRKTLLNEMSDALFEGSVTDALNYVRQEKGVEEVILSGGDPLLANPALLESTLRELSALSHVRRIRLHTRVPVTLPSRVDRDLVRLFKTLGKTTVVVTHFNHAKELTEECAEAIRLLKDAGVLLLNQSVLLKDVNDSLAALKSLFEGLGDWGVVPYYLHHPDRAEGTAHFDVVPERGLEIHKGLLEALPGYLVPRYVVDKISLPYKVDVADVIRSPTS